MSSQLLYRCGSDVVLTLVALESELLRKYFAMRTAREGARGQALRASLGLPVVQYSVSGINWS